MATIYLNSQYAQPENYAKTLQIKSFALAAIFTSIYALLLVVFVFKAVKNSTYVLWIIAFFCQGWSNPPMSLPR